MAITRLSHGRQKIADCSVFNGMQHGICRNTPESGPDYVEKEFNKNFFNIFHVRRNPARHRNPEPPVSAKRPDEVMCKQERDSHHVALYSCPQVHGGRISVLHHDLLLDAVDMHVLQLKVLYEAQPYSTLVYLGQAEEHVAVRHRHQVL